MLVCYVHSQNNPQYATSIVYILHKNISAPPSFGGNVKFGKYHQFLSQYHLLLNFLYCTQQPVINLLILKTLMQFKDEDFFLNPKKLGKWFR